VQTVKVVPAMTDEVKDALIKNIRRRMTPQPLKIRADIELKCFQYDGVLHIKVRLSTLVKQASTSGIYWRMNHCLVSVIWLVSSNLGSFARIVPRIN
jgi:translation initiation factor 2 alpha subunit (eIF-2alpha)